MTKTRKIYLTKEQKSKLKLDDYSRQVITGMLISDAWMAHRNGLYRIHFQQKQESFVNALWNILNIQGVVGKTPYKRIQKPSRNSLTWREENKSYESFAFQTFTLPIFTEIFHNWYYPVNGKNKKKYL